MKKYIFDVDIDSEPTAVNISFTYCCAESWFQRRVSGGTSPETFISTWIGTWDVNAQKQKGKAEPRVEMGLSIRCIQSLLRFYSISASSVHQGARKHESKKQIHRGRIANRDWRWRRNRYRFIKPLWHFHVGEEMRNDTKGFSQQKTMFNFTPHRLWRERRWTQAAQSGRATRLDARLMCRITSQTGPLECGLTGGSATSPSRLCLTPSVSSLDRQKMQDKPWVNPRCGTAVTG